MPIDREALAEIDEEILLADGWDDAFLGVTANHHHPVCAVYDYDRIIEIMVERDGMSHEDADEFAQFNIVGAYVGPSTPIYVRRVGEAPQGESAAPAGERDPALEVDQRRVARELIRIDEHSIVEVLEKYCHGMDSGQIHEVCDRAALEIKRLRHQVAALKQARSLSKQVEALERRLAEADRALFRSERR